MNHDDLKKAVLEILKSPEATEIINDRVRHCPIEDYLPDPPQLSEIFPEGLPGDHDR